MWRKPWQLWRQQGSLPVSKTAGVLTAKLGLLGEKTAARLFKARNCTILARNWRNNSSHDGVGELDIVLLDGETLVFAEVKTRSKADDYLPGANLSDEQKKRIAGSLALAVMLAKQNVALLRVHDVAQTVAALAAAREFAGE
jgi:putative endonuclease